jgi:hypothetical protein
MHAAGMVTEEFASIGLLLTQNDVRNEPALIESYRKLIAEWRDDSRAATGIDLSLASVRSTRRGFLALCGDPGKARLIGCIEDRIGDDAAIVLDCVRECRGHECELNRDRLTGILRKLTFWLDATTAMTGVRPVLGNHSRIRREALRQIDRRSAHTRAHDRARIARLANRARSAVLSGFGTYDEQLLEELCHMDLEDTMWLERIAQCERNSTEHSSRLSVRIGAVLSFGS